MALLFDDLMGWLANSARRSLARTAFLHLDFRAPVPWGTDLEFGCRITRMEGRKRHLAGQLRHGGLVLAEATGLWIELRPSAPHCGGGR